MKNKVFIGIIAGICLIPTVSEAGNLKKVYVNVSKGGGVQAQSNDIPANYNQIESKLNVAAYNMAGGSHGAISKGVHIQGKMGGGIQVDGSNLSYVDLGNTPELNHFPNGFTVEAWGKQTSYTGGSDTWLLDKDYTGYRIWGADNLNFYFRSPTQGWIGLSSFKPDLNKWYHVAGVVDNINLKAYLYVNGELKSSTNLPQKYMFDDAWTPLRLGCHSQLRLFWPGVIDEARVWNYPRTGQQISSAMEKSISPHEPGLVGYWSFD